VSHKTVGASTSGDAALVNAPPPTVRVGPSGALYFAAAAGTRPVAYAVYRQPTGTSFSDARSSSPFAVVDATSAADSGASYLPSGTGYAYRGAALYANGALSSLSATTAK